jgi:hypothetical protein
MARACTFTHTTRTDKPIFQNKVQSTPLVVESFSGFCLLSQRGLSFGLRRSCIRVVLCEANFIHSFGRQGGE